jgi:hypothetical protein
MPSKSAAASTETFTPTVSYHRQLLREACGFGQLGTGAISPSTPTLNSPSLAATPQTATMHVTVGCTRNDL